MVYQLVWHALPPSSGSGGLGTVNIAVPTTRHDATSAPLPKRSHYIAQTSGPNTSNVCRCLSCSLGSTVASLEQANQTSAPATATIPGSSHQAASTSWQTGQPGRRPVVHIAVGCRWWRAGTRRSGSWRPTRRRAGAGSAPARVRGRVRDGADQARQWSEQGAVARRSLLACRPRGVPAPPGRQH
jgi:hypothetical protein